MGEFDEILQLLNMGLWLADLPTLAIFFYVCQQTGKVNSSLITVTVTLTSSFFMVGYEKLILAYAKTLTEYSPAVDFFWYMGFACFYGVTLYYIRKVHVFKNVAIGTAGLYINKAFTAIGLLQLAQYSEIVLFKTDKHLDALYRMGVPAINISATIVCFSLAIYTLFHVFKKSDMETLRWDI